MPRPRTLDAAVALARKLTRERPDLLVLIEDLPAEAKVKDVAKSLDVSPKLFGPCHAANWARWNQKAHKREKREPDLPPSFAAFVERYGSFTWLASHAAGLDGDYCENMGAKGFALLRILNSAKRKELTASFNHYDWSGITAHDRKKYGLDTAVAFSGWVNNAYSFDRRRKTAGGECAIACLDEDQIFGNTPATDQIEAREQIPSFEAWFCDQITRIARQVARTPRATPAPMQKASFGLRKAFEAVAEGSPAKLRELLSRERKLVKEVDPRTKVRLLTAAAHERSVAVLRVLIEAGADVNKRDDDHDPPLAICAARGSLPAVKMLVAAGARLRPIGGAQSALDAALGAGKAQVAKQLLALGARPDSSSVRLALHYAPTLLPKVLAAKAKVSRQALREAVAMKDLEPLKLFIRHKAKLNELSMGWAPLHYAAYDGRSAAIEALVRGGAKIDVRSKGPFVEAGLTPLHVAIHEGAPKTVALLLKLGADPTLKTDAKQSAEQLAQKKKPIAKLLENALQ